MVDLDLLITKGGRIVLGDNLIELYHQDPVPVYNFTSIDNFNNVQSTTSGTFLVGTFVPSGIDMFNKDLGGFGYFDLSTSGVTRYASVFDIQYKRAGMPISGTKHVGRF